MAYDAGWATGNTPLRLYKQYAHHGGTLTPMIAHWPKAFKHAVLSASFPHLVDIMATVVDVAETEYPNTPATPCKPWKGLPLLPVLQARKTYNERNQSSGNSPVITLFDQNGNWLRKSKDWELYNVAVDHVKYGSRQTKTRDDQAVGRGYDQWANRVEAKTHKQSMK